MKNKLLGVAQIGHPERPLLNASCRYIAGCDVNEALCTQTREKFGVPTFVRYEELLKQPGIDVVVIRTPNHLHKAPAIAALNAGKHVFCEKPLALSLADCRAMVAAARKARRLLQINLELRSSLLPARVKEIVDSGEIGEIKRILFHHYQGAWAHAPDHWRMNLKTSGGIYPEKLVHEVDLFRWFVGEVTHVQSFTGENVLPQSPFPDCLQSIFWFRNGAMGYMLHTQTRSAMNVPDTQQHAFGHELWFDLIGTRGSLRADHWSGILDVYHLAEGRGAGTRVANFARREDYAALGHSRLAHDSPTHFCEFVKRIQAGGREIQPPEDMLKTMQLTFAAERSVRTGKKTRV